MSVATAGTAIAIATGVGTAAASMYGASKAAGASERATTLQTSAAQQAALIKAKSDAEALAWEKQQAAIQQQNFNATQRANYDQWAARENRMSSLGGLVGLPARNIPAYMQSTAVVPTGTGQTGTSGAPAALPDGAPGTAPGAAPAGAAPGGAPPPAAASAGAPAVSADRGDIGTQVSNYFKARGVSDAETPYWVQKWAEFGAKDPAYFNQRLAQADIFGGGAGSAAAPRPGTPSPVPSPYTLGSLAAPYAPRTPALAAPTIRTPYPPLR